MAVAGVILQPKLVQSADRVLRGTKASLLLLSKELEQQARGRGAEGRGGAVFMLVSH